jgi:hypothetical protein
MTDWKIGKRRNLGHKTLKSAHSLSISASVGEFVPARPSHLSASLKNQGCAEQP